jgi:hypothetical protein
MTANIPKKPKPPSELDLSGFDRWLSAARRSKQGADPSANRVIGKAKRGAAKCYPPSAVVPILTKLGFRIRQVSVDCVDLLVEGVRELRRLQELAFEIACHRKLYCELEIVTDEVYHQGDDQWRVEVLFARADKQPIRAADYRWAAKRIREWAWDRKLLLDE